jgi:ABC-type glycerol-3-phosphate transport system substrate-binding protein
MANNPINDNKSDLKQANEQTPLSSSPPPPPPPPSMQSFGVPVAPPPPPSMEPPKPQNVVVLNGQDATNQKQNLPQEINFPASNNTSSNQMPEMPKKSGCLGKIIILFILLLIVGGFIFSSQFILKLIDENKVVTLNYWGLWETDSDIKPLIAEFESKNPKIKINYTKNAHLEYRQRLAAAIDRGEGPDIFRFHNTWVPMLQDKLDPVPNAIMTENQFKSTFYPVAINDLVATGTIYGIPLMIDGLGLYINEDLFAAAGVSTPTLWEDITKVGGLVDKLTVRQDGKIVTSAIALGTADNVENFSDIVALLMLQNGADLKRPQGELTEGTLIFYRSFADPTNPLYTWDSSLGNSVSAFAGGKTAMMIAPSWRAFDVKQINSALRFKIIPVPQLPCEGESQCKPVTWASYWVEGVSAKTKYKKQAWEFVKYMTSRDGASKLYTQASKTRLFGEPYARIEMSGLLDSDQYVGAYIKQAPNAKSFPLASRTHDAGLNDQLIKYLEDSINAMSTSASPKSVIENTLVPGFNEVLTRYRLVSSAPGTRTQ